MSLIDKLKYIYLFIVFSTLIVLVFGLRYEIKNNPDFVDKLTCERGGLTQYNLTDQPFIYKENQTDNRTDVCDQIIKISEKTNFIWLPLFILWGLILFPDIQKLFKE